MLPATQTVIRAPLVGIGATLLAALQSLSPATAAEPTLESHTPPSAIETYAPVEAKGRPPANPRDLSGKWNRVTPFQSYGAVTGGANEFGMELITAQLQKRQPDLSQKTARIKGLPYNDPVFTPAGKAAFERNFPGYGRRISNEHRNDPTASCDPPGVPRMLVAHAEGGMNTWEILQEKDRMTWLARYHHQFRIVWTDGRKLPPLDDDLYPNWNGFSVGRWEGNTFVVDSVGFNDKTWLDHNGYPHTSNMKLQERYRLLDADTLELTMTITDPEYYAKPFKSDVKVFKRDTIGSKDWDTQVFCVPSEEGKFNRLIRDGHVNDAGP